jgi:hypothetical protein
MYIRYSTSLIQLYFDTCAKQLLLTLRLNYSSAYVHIDVVVKYSLMSNMHEDVKFKFIFFLCYSPKARYGNKVHQNHYKSVRNELER